MRPCLRGYQVGVVDRTRDAFRRVRRVVLVMPTGAGKTVVAGAVITAAVEKGSRVLFLAHRKELIDQASDKLGQFGVPHGVIKAGRQPDLAQPVQVASVQTLSRRLDKLTRPLSEAQVLSGMTCDHVQDFDLVVPDECHHITANSYQQILGAWPGARVLGLTATPYRIDGAPLGDCFEHMEVGITVPELITQGFLVRTRTFAPPPPEELRAVHVRAGDYLAGEAATVLDRTGPTAEIIATWRRRAAGRLTVGFGCTVEHCQHLAQAFNDDGIPSAVVDGTMDESDRAQVLADLRAGRVLVVWNVAVLTEGFDLPDLSCLIWARPTKSRCLWRQGCGRIMRPAPGKVDGIILDHAGNGHRFGVPDSADHYSLTEARDKRESRSPTSALDASCPHCHLRLLRPLPAICPECKAGLVLRSERGAVALRDEMAMRELSPADEADRYQWYLDCVGNALRLNKRIGWVFYRYKDRWAEEPPAWMPVKARIYKEIYHREPPAKLVELAEMKGNRQEVMA
jgi:DNA repair protein RadD